MTAAPKWFGIKVLLRTEAVGTPRHRDTSYDPDGTLVEERIVLICAPSVKDAIERLRKQLGRELIEFRNAYDQRVRQRFLAGWDAFELFVPPADGAEVFSCVRRVTRDVSDAKIVRQAIPPKVSATTQRRRKRFIAAEIALGLDELGRRHIHTPDQITGKSKKVRRRP